MLLKVFTFLTVTDCELFKEIEIKIELFKLIQEIWTCRRVCNSKTFSGFPAMRITGYTRKLNTMEKLTQSWRRIWRLMRWTRPAPVWRKRRSLEGRSPTRTSSGSGTTLLGSCVPSSWLSPCRSDWVVLIEMIYDMIAIDLWCCDHLHSDWLCNLGGRMYNSEEWGLGHFLPNRWWSPAFKISG